MKLYALLSFFILIITPVFGQAVHTTCQHVLIYQSGSHYYQFDLDIRIEQPLPFDNLISPPVWSPDGSMMAIATANEDFSYDLSIVSDFGDEPRKIASGYATFPNILWSPDGNWIAFESQGKAFIVNVTDTEIRQIDMAHDNFYSPVSWSPDGKYLAISSHDLISGPQIYSMETGHTQKMLPQIAWGFYLIGGWSPDSKSIVLITFRSYVYSTSQIQLYDVETGQIRDITPLTFRASDRFLGWMPDGNSILFNSHRLSSRGLYGSLHSINVNEDELTRHTDFIVRSVQWLSDNERFIYLEIVGGLQRISIRNLQTSEVVRLTADAELYHENFTSIAISPDEKYIVFEAFGGENYEIFIINLETRVIKQIPHNDRTIGRPSWMPCAD